MVCFIVLTNLWINSMHIVYWEPRKCGIYIEMSREKNMCLDEKVVTQAEFVRKLIGCAGSSE